MLSSVVYVLTALILFIQVSLLFSFFYEKCSFFLSLGDLNVSNLWIPKVLDYL